MVTSSSATDSASVADWASLGVRDRCLLRGGYFVHGVGLVSLVFFFSDTNWLGRIGLAAVWLVPDVFAHFARPDLGKYMPGPLLSVISLVVGGLPGVIAEKVAESVGAVPVVSKGLFV